MKMLTYLTDLTICEKLNCLSHEQDKGQVTFREIWLRSS